MKILTIDVGTGTQDIFLYDSRLDLENGFKLVVPSPTMMVAHHVRAATAAGRGIVLTGTIMGGGPSHWAVADHVRAGLPTYATADAARSFNDDLDVVQNEIGLTLVGDGEAARLLRKPENDSIELRDFDWARIASAFAAFGYTLDVDAVGVAVFDHGNAPPGYSDRQFRFDYLDARIRAYNRLSAFAFPADSIPPIMTRLQAVVAGYGGDAPLVVTDTAPAAVLGASLDPVVQQRERTLIANVGNFHTLAFRLRRSGAIEGVFEHHTGEIDRDRLDTLLAALADSTLRHEDVFDDMGHGALVYDREPLRLDEESWGVAVTGPRRALLRGSNHRPYFAVPYGDMMIAGCFGILRMMADVLPEYGPAILESLGGRRGSAPWEF